MYSFILSKKNDKSKIFLGSLLVLLMFMAQILPLVGFQVSADDDGIILKLRSPASTTVLSGEEVRLIYDFNANLGQNTTYENPYLVFYVEPEEYPFVGDLDIAAEADLAQDYIIKKVPESSLFVKNIPHEIRLYPKNPTDALILSGRVLTFKHKILLTPHNHSTKIKMALRNGDDSVIKIGDSVDVIAQVEEPQHLHSVTNYVIGKVGETNLTNDLNELEYVKFVYDLNANGTYNSRDDYQFGSFTGKRAYRGGVIRQPLPEHAVFDQNKNPGWQLNGTDLEYEFGRQNMDSSYHNRYEEIPLYLKFPGAPVNTRFSTTSTVTYRPDQPQAGENDVVSNRQVSYTFKIKTDKYKENYVYKSFHDLYPEDNGKNVTVTESRFRKNFSFDIEIANNNSATLTVDKISDYKLDPRLYVNAVEAEDNDSYMTIGDVQINGIKAGGEIVDLGILPRVKKTFWGPSGSIKRFAKEQMREIERLEFTFPNTLQIPANKKIKLIIHTHFKDKADYVFNNVDAELNKFKNSMNYSGTYADGQDYVEGKFEEPILF